MINEFESENLIHFFELKNDRKHKRNNIKKAWGYKCAYCGIKPEKLTLDHVIPVCKGRDDREYNLVPACLECQRRKGNKNLENFLKEFEISESNKNKIIKWHYGGYE